MGSTTLLTQAGPFLKARGVNATDAAVAGFPPRIPTTTEPPSVIAAAASTQQAINIADGFFGVGQNSALIVPYALSSNNATFSMRVLGWRSVTGPGVATIWLPELLCEVNCLTCLATGVAGAAVLDTERFCDGITLVTGGNSNISMELIAPSGNLVAHMAVALKGYQKIECTFVIAASVTSMNALVSFY